MEFYSHRELEVPETGLSACTKQKKKRVPQQAKPVRHVRLLVSPIEGF